MKRLGPQDMLFLYGETPSSMMHVAALMPFTPPADAPANYLRQMFEDTRDLDVVAPWNLKLSHPRMLRRPDQSWVVDDKFDIDYHVRRSALASPGDERELGILVSRLHSQNIDFTRPPWELHFIEGLEGGRFAIYMKIHHSLVDGYTGNEDPRAQHVDRPVAAGSAAVLQRRAAFENALRGARRVAQSNREPARRCRRRGTIAAQCRKSVVQHSNPQRR